MEEGDHRGGVPAERVEPGQAGTDHTG
jgi:hypothetical protein